MIAVQKKEKPIIQFDNTTLWFSLYPYYISITETKPLVTCYIASPRPSPEGEGEAKVPTPVPLGKGWGKALSIPLGKGWGKALRPFREGLGKGSHFSST